MAAAAEVVEHNNYKKKQYLRNVEFLFCSLQVEVVGPEGKDATNLMLQRVRKLRKDKVPIQFDFGEVAGKFPVSYENSLNNVLRLEVSRYNQLLACIHRTLEQLEKALKGEFSINSSVESN